MNDVKAWLTVKRVKGAVAYIQGRRLSRQLSRSFIDFMFPEIEWIKSCEIYFVFIDKTCAFESFRVPEKETHKLSYNPNKMQVSQSSGSSHIT